MDSSDPIVFWTILSLGPVPVWHLLLHLFLPFWRRRPWACYAAAPVVVALFVPLADHLSGLPWVLFTPPDWVQLLCLGIGIAAFLVALWSIHSLTPRGFFAWAALRPDASPPERIRRGPYRFADHPAYLSIIVALASSFLASGEVVLLAAFVAISLLLALVMVLEQRELKARLGAGRSPWRWAHPT